MCGESARTRRHASSGSSRSSSRSAGRDLLGVRRRRPRAAARTAGRAARRRAAAPRPRPTRAKTSPRVVVADREALLRRDRAGVERRDRLVDRHAGLARRPRGSRARPAPRRASAAAATGARSARATARAAAAGCSSPYAQTTTRVDGLGQLGLLGLVHGDAEPLGGLLRRRRRRACGRGRAARRDASAGRRSRARGEPLEHVGAERCRRGDGDASLAEDGARPQRRERLLAVLVVGAVDDQHAVEVVELVLHDARARTRRARSGRRRRSGPCPRARRRVERSTGTRTPCSERQPSSSDSVSSPRSTTTGLTIARGASSSGSKTNTRRSTPTCVAASPTPCASCISVDHPLDEPAEVVVELLDLVRLHPQRRVAVLADLRERELAAGVASAFALRVRRRAPAPRRARARARVVVVVVSAIGGAV